MDLGILNRDERIELMRLRHAWLSDLANTCCSLEDFSDRYDKYLAIRGISLWKDDTSTDKTMNIRFWIDSNEDEMYSAVQCETGIKISSVVCWQNEVCAHEDLEL